MTTQLDVNYNKHKRSTNSQFSDDHSCKNMFVMFGEMKFGTKNMRMKFILRHCEFSINLHYIMSFIKCAGNEITKLC